MHCETLFLDAGGVFVNPNLDRVAEALTRHGVPADAARLRAAELPAKKKLDTGARVQATNDASRAWIYFDLLLEEAGVPSGPGTKAALAEIAEYNAAHNLWESVPADADGALRALRAKGFRLVVVSNANGTLDRLLGRVGLLPRFDHVLDSFDYGVEKPDPRFFQLALERSGARAESTLHVGDLYHVDVCGARAAGLDACLFDVAGLYSEADCPRVSSLTELAGRLAFQAGPRRV